MSVGNYYRRNVSVGNSVGFLRFSGSERNKKLRLHGFSDNDQDGFINDMKSTSRFCFNLGSGMFSWSSKKQDIVAQSTAEAQ
jgi:hypothetical protein